MKMQAQIKAASSHELANNLTGINAGGQEKRNIHTYIFCKLAGR